MGDQGLVETIDQRVDQGSVEIMHQGEGNIYQNPIDGELNEII